MGKFFIFSVCSILFLLYSLCFIPTFRHEFHYCVQQKSASDSRLDSLESSPHHHTISLRLILNFRAILRIGLPSGLFPSAFQINMLYICLPFMPYAPPVSFSLICNNNQWRIGLQFI
jgi:hypothetical protein